MLTTLKLSCNTVAWYFLQSSLKIHRSIFFPPWKSITLYITLIYSEKFLFRKMLLTLSILRTHTHKNRTSVTLGLLRSPLLLCSIFNTKTIVHQERQNKKLLQYVYVKNVRNYSKNKPCYTRLCYFLLI